MLPRNVPPYMRTKKGTVLSDKMHKTIVVGVTTYKMHPKYKKRFKVTKKLYAHDEQGIFHIGDTVTVREIRPLSKLKRWTVLITKEKKVT